MLAGEAQYVLSSAIVPAGNLLPAAERRRTGLPVKLALAAGQEAFVHAGRDAALTASVFTSSAGDGENLHHICTTLASPEREISPTRFHNSVHNAPAGYWSIATRAQTASTSLCAHDASFAAGLLDAAAQVAVDGIAVALIAYDQPYPEPLHSVRPIDASFGAALVLAPRAGEHAFAALDISFESGPAEVGRLMDDDLDALSGRVPAARCLPLLAVLARDTTAIVVLAYGDKNHLRIEVTPWH